jgi:hypothetical protein
MAENVTYPISGYPLSDAELSKKMGKNPLYEFLRFSSRDRVHFYDDFLGDTINLDNYVLATGATATAFAHAAHASGIVQGASGTTAATSGLQIYTPAMWYGDQYAGCEVRFRASVVTETRLECGFVDALPSVNTAVGNNLSTPSYNTAADVAIYLYNDASATKTSGFYTDGTAIAPVKTATTTGRPTANTFITVRIQLIGNQGYMWVDGKLLAAHNTAGTDYIEGGTALRFFLDHKKSDTTDSNVEIDYIRCWQARL